VNGAILHTWEGTVPGRETKGLEVFGRALAYYDELAKEGRIHGHSEFFAPSGSPAGMVLVTGDVDELRSIEMEDGYMAILTEAPLMAQGFRSQLMGGGSGDDVTEGITRYLETLTRLGIT
jgi:formylmethanofuran dehydrogenase subunit C